MGAFLLPLGETHETHHETALGGNTSHAPADLPPWEDVLAGSPINTRYWHYEWPKQYMNGLEWRSSEWFLPRPLGRGLNGIEVSVTAFHE